VVAEKQVEYVGGEVKLTNLIMYTFDVDGAIISFNINGEEYFYVRNLQQDIVALIDENGMIVADYLYDAWGNILNRDEVKNNSIARLNPYRYRGYRYDEETGWYYLNSRYYNPEIGRFINADGFIGETGDILGHNMYAYTKNNPVMMVDPSGYAPEWWEWAISGALIVGGIALCATGVGSGFGAGLIVAGGSMLSSNIMSAAGLDSKLALQIQSGLQVVAGTGLMFVPGAQALGASLIGGGMLSFAGGYVSESLGGSYALGWTIGNVVGSIVGGGIYQATRYSSGTAQAPMTGRANGRYTQITPNGKNVAYYNGRGQQVLRIDRSHTHFIKGIGDVQPHKHVISWWKYGGQWRWNGPTGNVYPF
jgi:RHS repeat-associated protein